MPNVPCLPENAPFDAAQRAWLNGFLAALFSQNETEGSRAKETTSALSATPLLILFGSQTGTAEALARRVGTAAARRGFAPRVMEANGAPRINWAQETSLLIITSTYGDGDVPDNAQAFWDWLQTDAARSLAPVHYAVLALGDSHYEHFCAAGKRFDARLEELGARRCHPRIDCDTDYESSAQAWTEAALAALSSVAGRRSEASVPVLMETREAKPLGYSKANPFPAVLVANRELTARGSGKEVRHFEISLEDSGIDYDPGDALGIQPTNCSGVVDDLLLALHCDGEEAVPSPGAGETSLRKALTECYDVTKPGLDLLQRMAEKISDLRTLLAPERKEDLRQWLWGREVIDLLLQAPDPGISAAEFVALLKPLAPRLYSISSSPKAHAGQVHLTVAIVRHASHGRSRKGVCSTFLADRVPGRVPVPIFIQKSHGFRLPASGEVPIVMVGPGTGVAPFRAFLHERLATGAVGPNWLFFGEQRAATDFYYREELEGMLHSGHLTRLSTAFSRDQANKIYVQDRMVENATELWAWLQQGAHFYVCGDALRMARDVDAALLRVLELGGNTREQAVEFIGRMKSEKRYQRDVY